MHGITQCYLPPGRGDIPALTPAEDGTRLSDPGVYIVYTVYTVARVHCAWHAHRRFTRAAQPRIVSHRQSEGDARSVHTARLGMRG